MRMAARRAGSAAGDASAGSPRPPARPLPLPLPPSRRRGTWTEESNKTRAAGESFKQQIRGMFRSRLNSGNRSVFNNDM